MRRQAGETLNLVDEKRGWDVYLSKLREVIKRGNSSVEPLDMIPRQQVASACIRLKELNAFDRATCGEPEIAGQISDLRNVQPTRRDAKR